MRAATLFTNDARFRKMRALPLPDMTELSDIVALDDVLDDDDNEEKNDDDDRNGHGEEASDGCCSPQDHPARFVSLGLHRSMSMPPTKQQASLLEEKSDDETSEGDCFYFPEEDESSSTAASAAQQQDSYLPQFYSKETLATVIPPPTAGATAKKKVTISPLSSPSSSTAGSRNKPKKRRQSTGNEAKDASEKEQSRLTGSLREGVLKRAAQREAALSNLLAFFGDDGSTPVVAETTKTSPTSVSMFPEKSKMKRRSDSLPSCIEATAEADQDQENAQSSQSSSLSNDSDHYDPQPASSSTQSSDFEFRKLGENDRTTSMPANLPSARVPRRPSLKKVSSFTGGKPKGEGNNNKATLKPSVSFSNLEIREYDVTLGDNPSCSFGPPVSLGWDFRDSQVVPLETYERARERKCPRRNLRQLVLSYNMRKYLLLKTAGYTKTELRDAMREVNKVKNSRKMTDMMLPIDDVMEGVVDHVKAMFQQK